MTRDSWSENARDKTICGALSAFAVMTTLAAALPGVRLAHAAPMHQTPIVTWSEPRIAWETNGHASNPTLVTDAWGKAHLFFLSQADGDSQTTLYHVEADNADAEPVDVLIGMSEYRVAADPYGRLHVVAHGGSNTILYTAVGATEAGDAGAWSSTARLGSATLGIDIAADTAGGLHLCYPSDHSVYYQRSDDGGLNWSDTSVIADASDPIGIATNVRCVADGSGAIHAAWSEASPPNFYPPEGVYYSQSPDAGEFWTAPDLVAAEHYSLPSLLADPRGRVHLLWQGDVSVGGRYYRQRMAEGGWGPTEQIAPAGRGGLSGDAFMALDSRDIVHLAMTIDGIYWSSRHRAWSAPVALSASLDDLPNRSGSIEQAALAIANGNELYVAFEFDFKRIYVITGQSDAPTAVRTPLSVATPLLSAPTSLSAAPTPAARITLAPTGPSAAELAAEASVTADENSRRNLPMLLGAGLALLVLAGTIWLRRNPTSR